LPAEAFEDGNRISKSFPQSVSTGNGDGLGDAGVTIIAFIEADDLTVGAGDSKRRTHIIARRGLTASAASAVVREEGSPSTDRRCGGGKGKGTNSAHQGDSGCTLCHGIPLR
jgi:hypothetical protein